MVTSIYGNISHDMLVDRQRKFAGKIRNHLKNASGFCEVLAVYAASRKCKRFNFFPCCRTFSPGNVVTHQENDFS